MEIVKLRFKELEYYGEDDTLDCEYFVVKEDDEIMNKKLKELKEICEDYDSFQDVEDYVCDNFMVMDIDVYEFIV